MVLTETERQTYEAMWALPAYAEHSPGAHLVQVFSSLVDRYDGRSAWQAASVLDAGTGSGKGALALREAGYTVTLCDLTTAGLVSEAYGLPFHRVALWDDIVRVTGFHDYVYCCDVLEHIPPPFTMLVIAQLLKVARKGVFLSISLMPDGFGAWVGKPLHQSVQSFTAWRDQIAAIGDVIEARDLLTSGIYFVRARSC